MPTLPKHGKIQSIVVAKMETLSCGQFKKIIEGPGSAFLSDGLLEEILTLKRDRAVFPVHGFIRLIITKILTLLQSPSSKVFAKCSQYVCEIKYLLITLFTN